MTSHSSRTATVRAFKTRLPRAFEMEPTSLYAKLSRLAFYETPDRAALGRILSDLGRVVSSRDFEALTWETLVFHVEGARREVRLDGLENNQLLGACRDIGDFRHGYEPEVACAIDCLTGPDAAIFDAGANWGPITFQCALRPGFRGRIHCFEPQPRAYSLLSRIAEELGLGETVRPMNLALSDRGGEAYLSEDPWSGNVALVGDVTRRKCRAARLDDLDIEAPQLIKIDVEGHERNVIDGARSTIERARPLLIFEDWRRNPKAHFDWMAGAGYRFHVLGWLDPFANAFLQEPPMGSDIQLLAALPFTPTEREGLPDRINVLATPSPLSAGTAVEAVGVPIRPASHRNSKEHVPC